MNNVLEFMGKDHDRLDGIFEEFKAMRHNEKTKTNSLFHEFKVGLQRHIVWEEEILFPLFEDQTGMKNEGPTAVMREEHRQIRDILDRIHNKLKEAKTEGLDTLEANLLAVLKPHNDKEESILYPWIDSSLTETERADAFLKMKNLPAEKYNKCCS